MWKICRGEPRKLANWPAEFGKICRGKLWCLIINNNNNNNNNSSVQLSLNAYFNLILEQKLAGYSSLFAYARHKNLSTNVLRFRVCVIHHAV